MGAGFCCCGGRGSDWAGVGGVDSQGGAPCGEVADQGGVGVEQGGGPRWGGSRGPARGLLADFCGQGADLLGTAGQVVLPLGVLAQLPRDARQPRQWAAAGSAVVGGIEPTVQHCGWVVGVGERSACGGGAQFGGRVVAVGGEQRQVAAQRGVPGLGGQPGRDLLGGRVEGGKLLVGERAGGGGGQRVVVAGGRGGAGRRVGEGVGGACGGLLGAVAGQDAGEQVDRGGGSSASRLMMPCGSPSLAVTR